MYNVYNFFIGNISVFAGAEAYFEQHVENLSGHGLPLNKSCQERKFSPSEDFLAGEIRAVLRKVRLGRIRKNIKRTSLIYKGGHLSDWFQKRPSIGSKDVPIVVVILLPQPDCASAWLRSKDRRRREQA